MARVSHTRPVMKLQLDRPDVLALTARFPELDSLQAQLRLGNRIELRSRTLPVDALHFLATLYEEAGTELAGRAAQLHGLVTAMR
jgi:hypothetical protein